MDQISKKSDHKASAGILTPEEQPTGNALSSSLTFGWRALLRIKHVPDQLFDFTVFPGIILLMFTYLFGGAIAGSTSEYLQFILPGILAMTITMLTMYTGVDLNRDIEKGVFDRFRTLPIWLPSPLVGALLVDMVRYTIAATIMLVLGFALGFRPDGGITGVVIAVTLLLIFSFCLSWIWIMLALILQSEKSLIMVSTILIVPFTFVSNVFVDPSTLPVWLQGFVEVNPVSILVSTVRDAIHGAVTLAQTGWLLLVCALIAGIFAPIAIYLYQNKNN